jgi:hypothetical protein
MKALRTLAAVLAALMLAAPNALAAMGLDIPVFQAYADQPQGVTFITDTLGGSGGTQVALNPTAPDIRQTDPRAAGPGPDGTGLRFITDTLGGNGGTPLLTATSAPDASFNWTDAAVGAATATGSILLLLSGTFIAVRKRGRLAL